MFVPSLHMWCDCRRICDDCAGIFRHGLWRHRDRSFLLPKIGLQNAVDDTGRFAMTNPTATTTAIINYAKSTVLESVADDTDISVTPDTVGSTNFVTIAADHNFQIIVPLLPTNTLQINALARVPISAR